MKVICVGKKYYRGCWPDTEVEIGDEFEVLWSDHVAYEFTKYPDVYWYKCNFAPIGDIDETQMERNYNLTPIPQ